MDFRNEEGDSTIDGGPDDNEALATPAAKAYETKLKPDSNKDGVFAFGGNNVIRDQLYNLAVDKLFPITVAKNLGM